LSLWIAWIAFDASMCAFPCSGPKRKVVEE